MSMIFVVSPRCSVSDLTSELRLSEQEAAIGFEASDLPQIVRTFDVELLG